VPKQVDLPKWGKKEPFHLAHPIGQNVDEKKIKMKMRKTAIVKFIHMKCLLDRLDFNAHPDFLVLVDIDKRDIR
jgi:hypothetical protein